MRSDILTKDLLDLKDRISKLTGEQRDILLDLVDPQPEPQASQKQATKKRKPRAGSKRAASLAEQIKATGKVRDSDTDPNTHCQKIFPGGFVCDEPSDANVHHLRGGTGYHEFEAGGNAPIGSAVNTEIKLDYVSPAGLAEN